MTPAEIVLILIGVVILVISMFLVDKSKSNNSTKLNDEESNNDGNDSGKLTKENINEIRKKVDLALSEVSEEILQTTEDKLSHLSNEKIIAVNDYSNLVLEKINQNHEEVIFLYNMLNEKEIELKDLIKEMESTKKVIKAANFEHDEISSNPILVEECNEIKTNQEEKQQIELDNLMEENPENNNKRILELYKQGNSTVEISKLLEIGQGEVKLVIDLFNKRRKTS